MLDEGMLPRQYYLIGDEAFTNTPQFLTPYSGMGIEIWPDSFNYHLSSMRQCIERAFGLLTKRWGIFWRPLSCRQSKWSTVCTVAAKLHNFCIDLNITVFERYPEDVHDGDEWIVLDNRREDDALLRGPACGNTRVEITRRLESDGARRPPHAAVHSRANSNTPL